MRRRSVAVSLALTCAACTVGTQLNRFEPANVPGGSTVTVITDANRRGYTGELLAVDDSAMLLVHLDTLTQIPLQDVRSVSAPLGSGRGVPDRSRRALLRRIARYPQGVTPDLERRLLEAYHQSAVVIGPQ